MVHTVLPVFTMSFHMILFLSALIRSWHNAGLPSHVSLPLPLGYQHIFATPWELRKTYLRCTIPKLMTLLSISLHMLASLENHASCSGKHWSKITSYTTVFYCELKESYSRCQNLHDPCVSGPVYLSYSIATNKIYTVH